MSYSNKSNSQEYMYNPLFTDVALPSALTFTNLGQVTQLKKLSISSANLFNNSLNVISQDVNHTLYSFDVSSTPKFSWSFTPYSDNGLSYMIPGFPNQVNQPFIADTLNNLLLIPTFSNSSSSIHVLAVNPSTGVLIWDFDTTVNPQSNIQYPVALVPYVGGVIAVLTSTNNAAFLNVYNIDASSGIQLSRVQITPSTPGSLDWGDGGINSTAPPPQLFSDGTNLYIYSSYELIVVFQGASYTYPSIFLASYNLSSGTQNWVYTNITEINPPSLTQQFLCVGNMLAAYSNGNFYLPVLHNSSWTTTPFQSTQDFGILPINSVTGTAGSYVHLDNITVSISHTTGTSMFFYGNLYIDSTNLYASFVYPYGMFKIYQMNLATSSVASISLNAPLQGLGSITYMSGGAIFGDSTHIYSVTNSSTSTNSKVATTQLSVVAKSNFTTNNLNLSSKYSGLSTDLPNGNFVGFGNTNLTLGGLLPSPKTGKIYFMDIAGGYIWSIS